MVDAPAIPRGILAKIRWVIDYHPWIWLLAAVEQIANDHILGASAFLTVFIVNLFIYEMWERFSQLAKRITGRRMAFAFIVIGAIFLALGIILLARVSSAAPASNVTPSAEDVANATAPIRAELDNAKQRAASLQSQLTAVIKERDAARQTASPAPLNNQNVEYRRLSTDQMRILIKEFADLKGDIPRIFLTRANDVRGEANQYMRDFMEAIERAGIEVQTSAQSPAGPDQTGVMIAVQDVNHQPLIAKKLAIALQKAGVETTTIQIPQNLIGVEFVLFVGPNPL